MISGIVIWITVNTLEKNFIRIIDSEMNLRKSYDQTLHGWGKALELFDRETEGHSIRVSELAMDLARLVGVEEEDLEHIRRGALLHDIGKMGIDEDLLNKPESLSSAERLEVEKHPLNAHKLLKDIPFLTQAMEIPVYHHEQWDGSGYPYQLSEAEIPLSARIFAIVDNWDALRSDRPYRKAWPKDKVISYLRSQSGQKFDPDLVEPFISLVE
jgi:putative nucleotidyltransferase with HDIG domain